MPRSCTVEDAASVAAEVRALVPAAESVAAEVREIVESVRDGGDAAVLEWERRFGGEEWPGASLCEAWLLGPAHVPPEQLTAALDALEPDVRRGLEVAVAN